VAFAIWKFVISIFESEESSTRNFSEYATHVRINNFMKIIWS